MNSIVIGISGKIGAGKDTLADSLIGLYPFFKRLAFAVAIKKIVALITGTTLEENMDREKRKKFVPSFDASLGQLQQKVGNGLRDAVGPNVWTEAILLDPSEFKIITDVRFPNEVEAIEKVGGIVIRLERSEEHKMEHDQNGDFDNDLRPKDDITETALDDYKFEHVIVNDGTTAQLLYKALNIMQRSIGVERLTAASSIWRQQVGLEPRQFAGDSPRNEFIFVKHEETNVFM